MVIAALVAFGILLVAWVLAPTDARPARHLDVVERAPEFEALPEAA